MVFCATTDRIEDRSQRPGQEGVVETGVTVQRISRQLQQITKLQNIQGGELRSHSWTGCYKTWGDACVIAGHIGHGSRSTNTD